MRRPAQKPFAKKSLGQNFLVDPFFISKIISALDIQLDETIVEIGPGRGALTEILVDSGAQIIAVELDRVFVPFLRDRFESRDNFRIVEADALEIDFGKLISEKQETPRVKLVANLPYYISTAILQKLIEQRHVFSSMILMFQREVVDRIAARPGQSERGFLTVLAEAYFTVEKLFDVPPEAFIPSPKVWSSVVRIIPGTADIPNERAFRDLVSLAFLQKRKTILNNLKGRYPNAAEVLSQAGIDNKLRPEALTLDQWLAIAKSIKDLS